MNRYSTIRSPSFQTGKFSRVSWKHRDASVESLFTFVVIDTRSTKASANSTFAMENYFSNTIEEHVDFWTPKTGGKNQNVSPPSPKQIYKAFDKIKLVCKRDRANPFNPTKMFTYKKNVVKYHVETEYNPGLIDYYRRCQTATDTPDCADDPLTITKTDKKYWFQRYRLFQRFNRGILLDRESFYSVCPEPLAHHIAKRCENRVAIDPFCGAGGNVIQLAMTCKKVIAMDVDEDKVRMAKINAKVYGVAHKIDFYVGDFFNMTGSLRFQADVVVMSPPWGGPGYADADAYTLRSMCRSHGGGARILEIAKSMAPNVAVHLPRTTNVRELISLAKDWGRIEIQQNVINEKINSITAFFGEFKSIPNRPRPPCL